MAVPACPSRVPVGAPAVEKNILRMWMRDVKLLEKKEM